MAIATELMRSGLVDRFITSPLTLGHVPGIHLAIVSEPYLTHILSGTKTVESRFSTRPIPPYLSIQKGDFVFLKRVGGPVIGLARASRVWFYELDSARFGNLVEEFGERLAVDDSPFWEQRASSSYCTLIELRDVQHLEPVVITKRDRRGWVVLRKAVPRTQKRLQL